MADDDARDLELAEKAVTFVLQSPPEDRVANVAVLFALARQQGASDAIKEIWVHLVETPLSRDAKAT